MTSGQTAPPGSSGLIIEIPEAEPITRRWRAQYDPMAALGVGPHVTVLFPFLPAKDIDGSVLATVLDVVGDRTPFPLVFRSAGQFPGGVVFLRPEPDEEIKGLTERLIAAFPQCPPYGGDFPDPVPHLTVGQGLADHQAVDLARTLARAVAVTDITTTVTELALVTSDDRGFWHRRAGIPLGTAPEDERL